MSILKFILQEGVDKIWVFDNFFEYLTAQSIDDYYDFHNNKKITTLWNPTTSEHDELKELITIQCVKKVKKIIFATVNLADNIIYIVLQEEEKINYSDYPTFTGSLVFKNHTFKALFFLKEIESKGVLGVKIKSVAAYSLKNYKIQPFEIGSYNEFPISFSLSSIKCHLYTLDTELEFNNLVFLNFKEKLFNTLSPQELFTRDPNFPKDDINWSPSMTYYTSRIRKITDYKYLIKSSYVRDTHYLNKENFCGKGIYDFVNDVWEDSKYKFDHYSLK